MRKELIPSRSLHLIEITGISRSALKWLKNEETKVKIIKIIFVLIEYALREDEK